LALIGAFVFLKTRQTKENYSTGNITDANDASKIEFNTMTSNDSGYSAPPAPAQIYGAQDQPYNDAPPVNKIAF
jgi:hypothetical protein